MPNTFTFREAVLVFTVLSTGSACEVVGIVGTCECPEGEACEPTPACPFPTNPFPGTGTGETGVETTGGTTEPLLDVGGFVAYGQLWCVREEGATYSDPPIAGLPVEYEDGSAPEGCQCVALDTAESGWLDEHMIGGEVVIEQTALESELGAANPLVDILGLRDDIYQDAVLECVDLVPPTSSSNTCAAITHFDTNTTTPQLDPQPVYLGNRDGETDCVPLVGIQPGCSFTANAGQIRLSNGVYRVPGSIFDGFIDEPTCLMLQGWGVTLDAQGAFILAGVGSADILHKLGLANGDHFVAVSAGGDRISLEDPWSAMHAYASMKTQSSFTLEIRRGTTSKSLSYRVIR